jgi:hypothetical protein
VLRVDGLRHAPPSRRDLLLAALNGEATQASQILSGKVGVANGTQREPTLVYGKGRPEGYRATPAAVPALEALAASAFATQASRPNDRIIVPAGEIIVEGAARTPRRALFWRALFLLTGLTFVAALFGLVGRTLLGWRRRGHLTISGTELRYYVESELLGRSFLRREQRVRLGAVSAVTRETAAGQTGLFVGVVALALGLTFGTLIFGDGVSGGSAGLVFLGLAMILGGVGAELAAYYASVARGSTPRCGIEVEAEAGVRVRLSDLDPEKAVVLLEAISQRMGRAPTVPSAQKR